MVLDQPVDAVVRTAALFVGGESNDDIAIRLVAFALVADQVGCPRGHLRLIVGSASAVEKSVFFGEDEWIQAPVFPLGFDDVGVSQQQNWLELAAAVVVYHEIRFGWYRAAQEDVGVGKSRGPQPLLNGCGDGCS